MISKVAEMSKKENRAEYDLEQRTIEFAKNIRYFIKKLPKTIITIEDGKQLVRASGSVGANYIEANESLSKKDFVYRIKVCKKEAKESRYWLNLLEIHNISGLEDERLRLSQEATELINIFASIIRKSG